MYSPNQEIEEVEQRLGNGKGEEREFGVIPF